MVPSKRTFGRVPVSKDPDILSAALNGQLLQELHEDSRRSYRLTALLCDELLRSERRRFGLVVPEPPKKTVKGTVGWGFVGRMSR